MDCSIFPQDGGHVVLNLRPRLALGEDTKRDRFAAAGSAADRGVEITSGVNTEVDAARHHLARRRHIHRTEYERVDVVGQTERIGEGLITGHQVGVH